MARPSRWPRGAWSSGLDVHGIVDQSRGIATRVNRTEYLHHFALVVFHGPDRDHCVDLLPVAVGMRFDARIVDQFFAANDPMTSW